MTTPAASLDTAPNTPAKPASAWEDLVDIFTEPVAVFRRRRDGRFWLATLVVTLIGAATFYVARPVLRPAIERQMSAQLEKMQADPNIPAEQKEALTNRIRGSVDSPFAILFPALGIPVSLFVSALALWLVAKFFGSGASLGQAMAVTSVAAVPRMVIGLVVGAVSLALNREVHTVYGATASPAVLGPDASFGLAAALSRLDLGVLWQTVLMGIGIALMGRLTRRGGEAVVEGQIAPAKGITAAFIVWALAGLLTVGQVLNS